MPRGMLIVNPASGRGRAKAAKPKVVELARALGLELELVETSGPGIALDAARTAHPECERILVIGGDGTVNEVVNGLAERTGGTIPVALIPAGTSNSAARELGVPFDLPGAVEAAARGEVRRIDLGLANGRRFFLCCGAGPAAYIVTDLHRHRRGAISALTYLRFGVRCFLRYGFPPIEVTVDGRALEKPGEMVVVSNMSHYGHPMKLTPEAAPDDGVLDVCVIRPWWRISYPYLMFAAYRHRLAKRGDVQIVRGAEILLESSGSEAAPVQIDGDPGGELPVRIGLVRRAQGFMVPSAPGGA